MGSKLPRALQKIHAHLAYTWMGLMFFLWVGFILSDVFRLTLWSFQAYAYNPLSTTPPVTFSRDIAITVTLIAFCVAIFSRLNAFFGPSVKHVTVILDKFPKAMSGFKIAQISDLHIDDIIEHRYVDHVIKKTNALNPDLIVLTGDIIDAPKTKIADIAERLKHLSSVHGIYFVTGNHEYYSDAKVWIEFFKSMNINVLRNECVRIGDNLDAFNLLGIDDSTGSLFYDDHGAHIEKAVIGNNQSLASILLAHQPKEVERASQHGIDLQLSGHTHNGQIWPFTYLVKLAQPYLKGLSRHKNTQIYVNPGTGFWGPPMRLGARSEITLLEIQSI